MNHSPEIINLEATIPLDYANLRLDQALAKLFSQYSRARIQQWIRTEQVTIDGKILRPRDKILGGEHIVVHAAIEAQDQWIPQALTLNIVYEDDCIIIINKPAGIVVHPAAGNRDGTLLNALLHHCPTLQTIPRAGIIHRLDKDTSGLLVVAKTLPAHHHLVKLFRDRSIKREYMAITNGAIVSGGTIEAPIGRHPTHRKRMTVTETGKKAITDYRIIERFRAHTLVKVSLQTGRTHQIRVHFAHIHYPLLGDKTYGGRLQIPVSSSTEFQMALRNFGRQALHAFHLQLIHPKTGEIINWTIPLPEDMEKLLKILQEDYQFSQEKKRW